MFAKKNLERKRKFYSLCCNWTCSLRRSSGDGFEICGGDYVVLLYPFLRARIAIYKQSFLWESMLLKPISKSLSKSVKYAAGFEPDANKEEVPSEVPNYAVLRSLLL